jgi:hypothetical protein
LAGCNGQTAKYFSLLKNRIDLKQTPFSERGSRLLIFHSDNHLLIRLAERWFKIESNYPVTGTDLP